jgi:hypothetical protein
MAMLFFVPLFFFPLFLVTTAIIFQFFLIVSPLFFQLMLPLLVGTEIFPAIVIPIITIDARTF